LFDKLGVNDRLGLAVYAFEHGLLRSAVVTGRDRCPAIRDIRPRSRRAPA
jgi:hypothetical protein